VLIKVMYFGRTRYTEAIACSIADSPALVRHFEVPASNLRKTMTTGYRGQHQASLPAEPNSFVGRERDLAELALLLGEVRAPDPLRGPRHPDKTRLALRAWPASSCPAFPTGHGWWNSDTTDRCSCPAARVAAALGIRRRARRPAAHRHRWLTCSARGGWSWSVDTCEQRVGRLRRSWCHRLLAGCPGLRA